MPSDRSRRTNDLSSLANEQLSAAEIHGAERSAEARPSKSIAMRPHTLTNAVADGTVTEEIACCGLMPDDIDRLAERYADAQLLVRLRNSVADGRAFMSVGDLLRWRDSGDTIIADLRLWHYGDIRDVFPARAGE